MQGKEKAVFPSFEREKILLLLKQRNICFPHLIRSAKMSRMFQKIGVADIKSKRESKVLLLTSQFVLVGFLYFKEVIIEFQVFLSFLLSILMTRPEVA